MKVIASAGPRCRLQLVYVPTRESGDRDRRYQVRVLDGTTWVTIHASNRSRPAREAFAIEAYWRGWYERSDAA